MTNTTTTTVVHTPYPQPPSVAPSYPGPTYQGYHPMPPQPGMPTAPYPTQYPPPYLAQPVGPPAYHESLAGECHCGFSNAAWSPISCPCPWVPSCQLTCPFTLQPNVPTANLCPLYFQGVQLHPTPPASLHTTRPTWIPQRQFPEPAPHLSGCHLIMSCVSEWYAEFFFPALSAVCALSKHVASSDADQVGTDPYQCGLGPTCFLPHLKLYFLKSQVN